MNASNLSQKISQQRTPEITLVVKLLQVFNLRKYQKTERRERDSNPRYPYGHAGFQDRCGDSGTGLSGLTLHQEGVVTGPTTGPKCGGLVTTNENAKRLGASTDHDGEGAERGREHDAELARIVAAWDELPAVLKGAMLAIVDSAGAARGR